MDPLQELVHDHRELGGLLNAVHQALSRIEHGQSKLEDELHEIRDGIEAFREALLEHFAHEQENILPFIAARFPGEHQRIERLIAEHDRIAEVSTRLVKDLSGVDGGQLDSFRASLAHFEQLYASHSKTELVFLREISATLENDVTASQQLRALLDEP